MTLSREIIAVLSNLGVVQGLFLAIYLLLLKRGNRLANFLLAMLLISLTVRVGKSVFNHYLDLHSWQRNLGLAGFLMVGPFLFFYGKALFYSKWKLVGKQYLHFVPALMYAAGAVIIPNSSNTASYLSYSLVLLQLIGYCVLSYRLTLSTLHQPGQDLLLWYRRLVWGVSSVWLMYLFIFLRTIPFYMAGAIFYSILIYIFSYLLLRRHVFQLQKYKNSTLNDQDTSGILEEVEQLFKTKKLFLKNDLTLSEMADRLSISHRALSQAINQQAGKNFSEYINTFRVEEAKTLLKDPDMAGEKITAIAFDSGFRNLTSFNQAFKANTQLTPSQFRKQFLKDS